MEKLCNLNEVGIYMKKMTIGLFTDTFYPFADGVIMVVDNYARRLVKYADVTVFAPKYVGEEFDDSSLPYKVVRCYPIELSTFENKLPIMELDEIYKREIENFKLDLVHIHSPFALGKAGVEYAKKHNIPCVATMHTQFKQEFLKVTNSYEEAERLINKIIEVFDKCDECFAVNSEVAKIFHEEYGYKRLPKVMNNATEMVPLKDDAKNYINDKYEIANDCKVFLFVGRMTILKNILFIAESLEKIKIKRPNLKFKMLYVGSGPDEDLLKQKIKELKLEENVIFLGKVTDRNLLASLYKRADLFLFPSLYDASSIVQIEAASQNTPTIFIKGSATSATVTDNVNGLLSDNTTDAYSDKIIEAIENKELYNQISENAYNDLYKTWDDYVKNVYDMYIKLLKLDR